MVPRVAALLLLATAVDGRGRAEKPGGKKKDPDANNHLQQVRPSLVPPSSPDPAACCCSAARATACRSRPALLLRLEGLWHRS